MFLSKEELVFHSNKSIFCVTAKFETYLKSNNHYNFVITDSRDCSGMKLLLLIFVIFQFVDKVEAIQLENNALEKLAEKNSKC